MKFLRNFLNTIVGATLAAAVLYFPVNIASGETGGLIARGWHPGEYLCIGPDSTDGGGISPEVKLYYTSDYGQHLEPRNNWFIYIGTDARDSCCYGFWGFTPENGGAGRSFDGGRNWDNLEQGIFHNGFASGRIPGEIYAPGQGDSIRYSNNFGDSYISYISEGGNLTRMLVGHQEGEIYTTGYDLYRSDDSGRTFNIIYQRQGGDDEVGFSNRNWLARGPLDGELYSFDEADLQVFRSTDHGRSWTMRCDLVYPEYARGRWYQWNIAPGVEEGEVVIYGIVSNYDLGIQAGGTIRFLVSHDYGRSFETFTPFDYVPGRAVGYNPTIPTFCSFKAFPNPFNSQTNLAINLPMTQYITLNIFDVEGRFVTQPMQGVLSAGSHRFLWPPTGSNLSLLSGCYFAVLNGQNGASISKLVIIK